MTLPARSASPDPLPAKSNGGAKRFLLLVLALFLVIVAALAAFMYFSGDPGSLPFAYDGFN
jgi:hypothetical protein